MRKPREHGWQTEDDVTHHIDTRRPKAYHPAWRHSTCGITLVQARRVRVESVDCMTCIVHVSRRPRRPRLPPRRAPTKAARSWRTKDNNRHELSVGNPWRAACGVSLRVVSASANPPNCAKCQAAEAEAQRLQERKNRGRLPRAERR